MNKREQLLKIFSHNIRGALAQTGIDFEQVQEIRLRIHAPLFICYKNKEYYVTRDGRVSQAEREAYRVSREDLRETMELIGNYSLYAYEDEIRQGFITIQGGHRVGIAGKTVTDGDVIRSMKYISFLNIRLAHEIKGCADQILPYIMQHGKVMQTLIVSPPRCGKTTLLRDLVRQISNGTDRTEGITVGVVDERSEIGACYMGEPQNELGIRTDVLDCCPKAKGMMMLIRMMSPQVIAIDEVGSREELEAIEYASNCGCKMIATIHGSSMEDVKQKPVLRKMIEEKMFERYILLDSCGQVGHVAGIFDAMGNPLYHERKDVEK